MQTKLILLFLIMLLPLPAAASEFSSRLLLWKTPLDAPPLVFEDGNGVQHALSEYKGRFILLNVWATWCPPCVKEMPTLDRVQQRFDPQRLLVLPLSQDFAHERVFAFYQAYKIRHLPHATDRAGLAPSVFQLKGLPTTLLLDPKGREIARIRGYFDWNDEEALLFLQNSIEGQK